MNANRVLQSVVVATMVLVGASEAIAQELWTDGGRGRFGPDDPVTFGAFRDIAAAAAPAVVHVRVELGGGAGAMFGLGGATGEGTGFIIEASGYIITNNHVIDGANRIVVRLDDATEYPATIVGADPRTDVALIRIEREEPFPIVPLGDSSDVAPGDWVVAIGNPFGLDHSVTAGIVSAVGRRDVQPDNHEMYADFLQTDAPINPGNSGGPLLDINGHVIGVNTAVNRAANNIGFAIPIDMVKALVPQLATGAVERSWLGVRLQELDAATARELGLDREAATLVTEVVAEGPAAHAGILPGDIILEFDGEPIDEFRELPWLASIAGVGREVEVVVLREGAEHDVVVSMGRLPGTDAVAGNTGTNGVAEAFGVRVGDLTPEVAAQIGVADGSGIVVLDVDASSNAGAPRRRPGDVVIEVNCAPVRSASDFTALAATLAEGALVQLRATRGTASVFLVFRVD